MPPPSPPPPVPPSPPPSPPPPVPPSPPSPVPPPPVPPSPPPSPGFVGSVGSVGVLTHVVPDQLYPAGQPGSFGPMAVRRGSSAACHSRRGRSLQDCSYPQDTSPRNSSASNCKTPHLSSQA
ncbi:hypothetical protein CDL16_17680 [Pseudomonas aeruginosa]|nr:hypothetical protein CDL16_17680 [Pseudomonas aeruginosa]